jgi:membrane protease YdiL (CAAX protease family)
MKASRILLEMLLFFLAFFLPGYLAQAGASAAAALTTTAMLQVIVTSLPQFLLMAYVAGLSSPDHPGRWGLVPFRGRDALWTLALVAACFAVVALFALIIFSLPPAWSRTFTRGYRWGLQGYAQVPVALLFGLAAGYREEFFFRAYLLGRLGELGVPLALAGTASTILFCAGHLYEGPFGIAVAAVLGAILCITYIRRPNLHVVAIAHGLYNATVLVLSIPLSRALPAAGALRILF